MFLLLLCVLLGACGHRGRRPLDRYTTPAPVATSGALLTPGVVTTPFGHPPPPPPPPPVVNPVPPDTPRRDPGVIITQINGELRDAFFEYDRAELRPDSFEALRQDAALLVPILLDFPGFEVVVEGHCDERGSAEYNLGLGDNRAARAADILKNFGVPAAQIRTVSYGKERPQCTESGESCWQRNRRAHLYLVTKASTSE